MQCGICLNNLTNGLTVRLPCGHLFHRVCMTTLLTSGYNAIQQGGNAGNYDLCPYCRVQFTTTSGLGTLDDYVGGTMANFVTVSLPGMGIGVEFTAADLA
jgi:hypothetical protein